MAEYPFTKTDLTLSIDGKYFNTLDIKGYYDTICNHMQYKDFGEYLPMKASVGNATRNKTPKKKNMI